MLSAVIGLAFGRLIIKNDNVAILLAVIGIFVRGLMGNDSTRIMGDKTPD